MPCASRRFGETPPFDFFGVSPCGPCHLINFGSGDSRRVGHAVTDDPLSPNDKTLRCGSYEEKWIASHEGKDLIVARIQNGDITGVDHFVETTR